MKATTVTVSEHILVILLIPYKHKQRNPASHPNMHSHLNSACAPMAPTSSVSASLPMITQGWSVQPNGTKGHFCPTGKSCINASCVHYCGKVNKYDTVSIVMWFKWWLMSFLFSLGGLYSVHCFNIPFTGNNTVIFMCMNTLHKNWQSRNSEMLSFNASQANPVPVILPLLIFCLVCLT